MFPVYVLEEGQEIPDDNICYIVAKGGVYMKKKLDMVESLAKVDSISILADVKPYAKLDLPKIPGDKIAKVIDFFRKVYEEHRSEGCVILYYNEENNNIRIVAPKQEVSGASVDYESEDFVNYRKVGTIHSHANFSAFHSGIDDADEFGFDGLHITFGHVGSSDGRISVSCSIVVNAARYIGDITDYADGLTLSSIRDEVEEVDADDPADIWGFGNATKAKTYTFEERFDLDDDLKEIECNKKWLKQVDKKVYTYKYAKAGAYSGKYGSYSGKPGNGGYYSPAQKVSDFYSVGGEKRSFGGPPSITTNNYKQGQLFNPSEDKHIPDVDESPCESCIYKAYTEPGIIDMDDAELEMVDALDAEFDSILDGMEVHGEDRDYAHAIHDMYPDLDPDEIAQCLETMEASGDY